MEKKYIGEYKILEDGTVFNKNGSIKKWFDNKRGYPISRFSINGKWSTMAQHTIVAKAFLGPRKDGYEVNHKDNNKWNNSVSNLEYLSKRDNRLQMYKDGRTAKGINNANCKYTEEQIHDSCEMLESSYCYKAITICTGVSASTLGKIKRKQQWKDISEGYSF